MLANATGPIAQMYSYSQPTMDPIPIAAPMSISAPMSIAAPMPNAAPMSGITLLNLQYVAVFLKNLFVKDFPLFA